MAGTENTIFSDAIIKLKHATKSVADASDKVLEKDEVLLVSPNSGSGTGAYEMRVGDGSTPVKNLPVAINGMKADNINVEEIETIEEENPTLEGGNAIKNLFGRISKKFSWIETMLGKKVNIADIYDGLDSNNAEKVASANAVRQINEKTDKNTTDISTLTSDLTVLNAKEIQFKPAVKPVFTSTNNLASGAEAMFTVTFDKAFSAVPTITFTLRTNGDLFLSQVDSISTTGFTGYIRNPFPSAKPVSDVSLCYIAMC